MHNLSKTKNSLNLDHRIESNIQINQWLTVSQMISQTHVRHRCSQNEMNYSFNRLSSGWHLRVSLFADYPMLAAMAQLCPKDAMRRSNAVPLPKHYLYIEIQISAWSWIWVWHIIQWCHSIIPSIYPIIQLILNSSYLS